MKTLLFIFIIFSINKSQAQLIEYDHENRSCFLQLVVELDSCDAECTYNKAIEWVNLTFQDPKEEEEEM